MMDFFHRFTNRAILYILTLIPAAFFLSACSQVQESADAADTAVITAADENVMTFLDVNGVSHTFTVDEAAAFHDYDTGQFVSDGQIMTYADTDAYSFSCGIDVSYYQGEIDWTQVKASGIDFVFIRIGYRGYGDEGTLNEDACFRENLTGAQAAGLDVGVYFFAQAVSEEEAKEEADFVLALLDGAALTLPVIYDPEYILDADGNKLEEARTSTIDGEQITNHTIVFCSAMEEAGYTSGFYANMLFEAEVLDMAALSAYPVWYADYEASPQTPYAFSYWQYSENGSIAGIEGAVDLNIRLY